MILKFSIFNCYIERVKKIFVRFKEDFFIGEFKNFNILLKYLRYYLLVGKVYLKMDWFIFVLDDLDED